MYDVLEWHTCYSFSYTTMAVSQRAQKLIAIQLMRLAVSACLQSVLES